MQKGLTVCPGEAESAALETEPVAHAEEDRSRAHSAPGCARTRANIYLRQRELRRKQGAGGKNQPPDKL